ncbi:hypothetical protein ACFOYW_06270 [Gryllotalpicola reticulitermitis]|uniref:Uncharacterized protein n=1 Tax=Gryllotalpicola reticulitermitis TaxID=1184153 RepID=A0ABV8Q3M6_9MICO
MIDEALADYETTWAAAGTLRTVLLLSFDQLRTLTSGTPVTVAAA